jgi:hypothetical protein
VHIPASKRRGRRSRIGLRSTIAIGHLSVCKIGRLRRRCQSGKDTELFRGANCPNLSESSAGFPYPEYGSALVAHRFFDACSSARRLAPLRLAQLISLAR